MGNCPSDLTCQSGEKKICFRDTDTARTKLGFCLNTANLATAKKISAGTALCPDCPPPPPPPPPCPTPGFYFLGKDLGNLDDHPALKDYFNIYLNRRLKQYCLSSEYTDFNYEAIRLLSLERDFRRRPDYQVQPVDGEAVMPEEMDNVDAEVMPEDTTENYSSNRLEIGPESYFYKLSFDKYISDSRRYIDSLPSYDDYDLESKSFIMEFIDFIEANKSTFSTNENIDIQKFADFIKLMYDKVCSSTTTEGYTGEYSKNNLLNFIFLIVLLVIVHFLIHKK